MNIANVFKWVWCGRGLALMIVFSLLSNNVFGWWAYKSLRFKMEAPAGKRMAAVYVQHKVDGVWSFLMNGYRPPAEYLDANGLFQTFDRYVGGTTKDGYTQSAIVNLGQVPPTLNAINGTSTVDYTHVKFWAEDANGNVILGPTEHTKAVVEQAMDDTVGDDPDGLGVGTWEPCPNPLGLEAPVVHTDLVYNGASQTGVVLTAGYLLESGKVANKGAGTYTANVKPDAANGYFWADDGSTTARAFQWSIAKATMDMTWATFAGLTCDYDGTAKSLSLTSLTGVQPQNFSKIFEVDYENNGQVAAGTYTVTVNFTQSSENYRNNYNDIAPMTATLKINMTGSGTKSDPYNGIGSTDRCVDYLPSEDTAGGVYFRAAAGVALDAPEYDGYVTRREENGDFGFFKAVVEDSAEFVLDTRSTRVIDRGMTDTFAFSGSDWGVEAGDTATITYSIGGAAPITLGNYRDGVDEAVSWTADQLGTWTFRHMPGGETATFTVLAAPMIVIDSAKQQYP